MKLKTCEVMQYLSYMNPSDISVSDIEERIKSITYLKSYCLIVHDKDVKEDGSPKAPHFHAVLTFSNAKTVESIAKAVGVEPQYVNKIKGTTRATQLYLIHRNNPEKYQYDVSAVRANFDYSEIVDDSPRKLDLKGLGQSIVEGKIHSYDICNYVTPDEYHKHKKYFLDMFEYRNKVLSLEHNGDRSLACVFITGGSRTGKTTYAKSLARQMNLSAFISSSGKNPLDDYEGQGCIILDDVRPSDFKFNDFLKMTDNNTDSLVGCRYYNRSISECKLLICTSTLSLDDYYKNLQGSNSEAKKQILRRFSLVYHMSPDWIEYTRYNPDSGLYTSVRKVRNKIISEIEKTDKDSIAAILNASYSANCSIFSDDSSSEIYHDIEEIKSYNRRQVGIDEVFQKIGEDITDEDECPFEM